MEMRNVIPLLSLVASTALGLPQSNGESTQTALSSNTVPMRLFTHNIRYNATNFNGAEKPWQDRRPKLVNEVRLNTFNPPEAMVCFQEVLNNQLLDILTDLNAGNTTKDWSYIGVGRDDGQQGGEYSPLFYRPSVWHLDEFKTVWLSETPDKPSIGWDAGSIRILTIGVFTHRQLNKQLVGMCTHLDNAGSVSRENSAKIIIDQINAFTGANETYKTKPVRPVFLGGDFNSNPNQEAYQELSKPYSPITDLRLSVPESQHYGNNHTWTDFNDDPSDDDLLDFIWLGPKNQSSNFWTAKTYGVLANKFDDGVFDSDHRAVVGDVLLTFP